MDHANRARELFLSGYNCAQSVLCAFSDVTGLDENTARRLASSFGGGMGRMRETCGTCSAMFLIAGLCFGDYPPADREKKAQHYKLIQDLAARFKAHNGTICCRELLATLKPSATPIPEERTPEYYKIRPCVRFVEDAAHILDEMLKERTVQ